MIERNVVDVLVPETPKMLSKQEFFVYVPTATYDSPGVASYDKTTLIIQNGIVSVRGDFLDGVIEEGKKEVTKLIDEAIIIIDEKILKVSNFESKIDAIYSDIQRIGESAEINAAEAETSAGNAEFYASQAQASQVSALASEQSAISSANDSQQHANNARQSAISAEQFAELARQYSELGISFNFQYTSVDELPRPGSTRFIYMIKVRTADTGDITENLFDEYVWVPKKNDYEQIGSDSIDLSNYAQINGKYPNMTVGNATNATNAQTATKASRDGNNNIINDTYATKQALTAHVNDLNNPHEVTAAQVGAYVKPSGGIPETDLSTAVQQALWTNNSIVLTSDTGTLTSEQLKTLTASYGNFIQYGANVYNYNYTEDNNRVYSVQRSINDSDSTTDVIGYFGKVQVDMTSGAYQIYTFTVNNVVANPTLSGSEAELTGLEVAGTKYSVVTKTYVDNLVGDINTALTDILGV